MAKNNNELPLTTIIEVVVRKEMTIEQALKIKNKFIEKGWRFGKHQLGNCKTTVTEIKL